jgi:hypothetical protein
MGGLGLTFRLFSPDYHVELHLLLTDVHLDVMCTWHPHEVSRDHFTKICVVPPQ